MKKIISILVVCSMCLCLFAGCAGKNSESGENDAEKSGIAVVADTQSPTSLDPAQSWNSWYILRWGIAETLFRLDEQLTPKPWLAESCEMQDENTWVITIKDGITFQNGSALTAEAVKACWERTETVNARFGELLYIDSMDAQGQTLTVKTEKPNPAFINGLCDPLSCVIDISDEDSIETSPIGTGPFKAVSYDVNVRASVEKYSEYWGGEPKLNGAEINIIGDTNTLSLAQQNGESDISVSMPSTALELFSDESRYNVDSVTGSRGQVIFINYENEFLQQRAVRQALSMCIDKESYAEILNHGASVPASGLYPDFMGLETDGGYEYDMDGAAKCLDDAGITDSDGDGIREINGENISLRLLTYSTKAELPSFCNEIASSAKKIGIDISVEVYESVTEQQKSGDFDLMMVSFTMTPTGDVQYFADIAFKTGGSSNYGGYSNPAVDELIDRLDREFDSEKRMELAADIQKTILEDAGFIVVGHAMYTYVMSASLKGLHTNPSEYYLLDADVYLEK